MTNTRAPKRCPRVFQFHTELLDPARNRDGRTGVAILLRGRGIELDRPSAVSNTGGSDIAGVNERAGPVVSGSANTVVHIVGAFDLAGEIAADGSNRRPLLIVGAEASDVERVLLARIGNREDGGTSRLILSSGLADDVTKVKRDVGGSHALERLGEVEHVILTLAVDVLERIAAVVADVRITLNRERARNADGARSRDIRIGTDLANGTSSATLDRLRDELADRGFAGEFPRINRRIGGGGGGLRGDRAGRTRKDRADNGNGRNEHEFLHFCFFLWSRALLNPSPIPQVLISYIEQTGSVSRSLHLWRLTCFVSPSNRLTFCGALA